MAKYNKTNWQTGMEITHEVLINADNFQIEQQNIIRRLQVMPCYGLLPESIFNADLRIDSNVLSIKNLQIQAISPQGELVDMDEQGKEAHRVDLSQYAGDWQAYIALYSNDAENVQFCITTDPQTTAAIIGKISDNIVSSNYIPPCISINSHYKLLESFEEIKQITENIITQISGQERYKSIFLPFSLLALELKSYSAFETPADLFLVVKKLATVFKSTIAQIPENMEILLNQTYYHTEIYDIIYLLLNTLCEMEELTKAPAEAPKIQKIQIAVK
jgi:hypothetical protein